MVTFIFSKRAEISFFFSTFNTVGEVSKVRDQAATTSRRSCETKDSMTSYCMLCYAKQREIEF